MYIFVGKVLEPFRLLIEVDPFVVDLPFLVALFALIPLLLLFLPHNIVQLLAV